MSEKTSDVPETFPKTVWLRENDGVLEFTDEGDPCGFAYSAGQSEDSARFDWYFDSLNEAYWDGYSLTWFDGFDYQTDSYVDNLRAAIDKARKA